MKFDEIINLPEESPVDKYNATLNTKKAANISESRKVNQKNRSGILSLLILNSPNVPIVPIAPIPIFTLIIFTVTTMTVPSMLVCSLRA